MKRLKNYVLWAMLSIMLQCSVVIYLDKVYFRQSSDFVLTEVKPEESKKSAAVPIPDDAENIKVSYDGKYATYNIDEKFYLVDVSSGESNEIITNDGEIEVLYSAWLPDRNGITIAEKKRNDAAKNVIDIVNYNAKTNMSIDIKEICSYSKGMKVDNISTNTLSAVTYVSVTTNQKNSTIYRVNIEHDMDVVTSKMGKLGDMEVFPHKDILVYNSADNNRFYSYVNGKVKKMNFNNSKDLKLLELDNNNNVYIGKLENDEVKEILCGTLDSDISTWKQEKLDEAVDADEIYINNDGEIMINDKLEGKITNLSSSKTIDYDGKFISVNNKVICSMNNGKLNIKKIGK